MSGDAPPAPPPVTSLKEVVVFRSPPVVHVYDVTSHGRRFYRTLVASSDNAFCLHDMPTALFLQGETPRLVAGNPRDPTPAGSTLWVIAVGLEFILFLRIIYKFVWMQREFVFVETACVLAEGSVIEIGQKMLYT